MKLFLMQNILIIHQMFDMIMKHLIIIQWYVKYKNIRRSFYEMESIQEKFLINEKIDCISILMIANQ